jgi:class 3 adenylate cyclase
MSFKIALHLDEVIYRGERLYGQAVHAVHQLVARTPGGEIYVSHPVYERVEGKLGLAFEDLGESRLSALNKPLHLYRVLRPPLAG